MSRENIFLKVTCVLMIIGAAISIILGIIGVISCIIFANDPAYESALPLLTVSAVVAVSSGTIELIAGIVGIKNSGKPEKAATCIVLGFISLAANIADQFLSNSISASSAMETVSGIFISLAIPVLYIIGAILNKAAGANG